MFKLFFISKENFYFSKLVNILKKYNINNSQIYSITCDNGANLLKMVRILNDTSIKRPDEIDECDLNESTEEILDEYISSESDEMVDTNSRGNIFNIEFINII